jgi:hypothetical protein
VENTSFWKVRLNSSFLWGIDGEIGEKHICANHKKFVN